MDTTRFKGLSDVLTGRLSRRQAVQWLAAGGASAVLVRAGMEDSAAKKGRKGKGKGKGKGKNKNRCTPGSSFGSVSVPATGATVTTPILTAGQQYRLRASGFWVTNAQYGNDAFAAFPFANPNAPELTFNNVRLGLSVDGGSPDQWGSYNAGHVYERTVTGAGVALSLKFTDPIPADNSGSLTVEIFCA
jgi:hypothetical protein